MRTRHRQQQQQQVTKPADPPALVRLREQVRDLVIRYEITEGIYTHSLMDQLRCLGPYEKASNDVVGKIQPGSKPPGSLAAHVLHARILFEAGQWAYTLNGEKVREDQCIAMLPTFAQRRLENRDRAQAEILYNDREHGRKGLLSAVGTWHHSAAVLMGWDEAASHYPEAICPYCLYRDERGRGSIYAYPSIVLGWCSNKICRMGNGRRTEFTRAYFLELLREYMEKV